MSYFQNKVVWITGASSGIGEALALAFASAGAKLILSARRENELNRVKVLTGLSSENVFVLPMDVAEISTISLAAEKALHCFGRIDILVNNAGLSHWSKIKDTSLDVIQHIMNVNFFGGAALTKAVLPFMLQQKNGDVVVVSSILGKMITQKQGAYNASKHALMGFYETLRAESFSEGINVLLVCPGFVKTNVAKNSLDRNGKPINKDNQLIANGLEPAYVASVVLKSIQKKQREVVVAGFKERFALLVKRFFPNLFERIIASGSMV